MTHSEPVDFDDSLFDDAPEPHDDPSPVQLASGLSPITQAMQALAKTAGGNSAGFIISSVTDAYLSTLDPAQPPAPTHVERMLLTNVNNALRIENGVRVENKDPKHRLLEALTPFQVAHCLKYLHYTVCIAPSIQAIDTEYDLLAIYQPEQGIYTHNDSALRRIARTYNQALTLRQFDEVRSVARDDSPRVTVSGHRDLIAVGNGVFNYSPDPVTVAVRTRSEPITIPGKTLHPHDPGLVFTAKSEVNFDPHATSPTIVHPEDGTSWEVEQWMAELSDNPEIVELLWQILSAITRPHVRWGKSAWFYSERGNNGKGTLCALMRNLIGPAAHTSIPVAQLGDEFALEPLMSTNAIITDENDVGTFVDRAANLKAIVTNDVLRINRKYRMPVAYQFWGFMVQCLNDRPQFKDKSDSLYRRQLFIPFRKCFTGAERRYIKNDYLRRPDVLAYVLKRVLLDDTFYELSSPAECEELLSEMKEFNDPVRSFWEEMADVFVWSLLPFPFLYDLYKAWFAETNPSGKPVGRNRFIHDLLAIVGDDPQWTCKDTKTVVRVGSLMDAPELLITRYSLNTWMSPTYHGPDPRKLSRPALSVGYRGLVRRSSGTTTSSAPSAPSAPDTPSPNDGPGLSDPVTPNLTSPSNPASPASPASPSGTAPASTTAPVTAPAPAVTQAVPAFQIPPVPAGLTSSDPSARPATSPHQDPDTDTVTATACPGSPIAGHAPSSADAPPAPTSHTERSHSDEPDSPDVPER